MNAEQEKNLETWLTGLETMRLVKVRGRMYGGATNCCCIMGSLTPIMGAPQFVGMGEAQKFFEDKFGLAPQLRRSVLNYVDGETCRFYGLVGLNDGTSLSFPEMAAFIREQHAAGNLSRPLSEQVEA